MPADLRSPVPKEQLVQLYRQALLSDIPLETVHQKVESMMHRVHAAAQIEADQDRKREQQLKKKIPWYTKAVAHAVPLLCIGLGVFLVGNAVLPIMNSLFFTDADIESISLLSPIPRDQVLDAMPQVVTQVQANTVKGEAASPSPEPQEAGIQLQPQMIDTELDYINLSNWFPTSEVAHANAQEEQVEYSLDIPAVEVEKAKVKIGGTNLDHNLIQYPCTSLPGASGAPVIFGHSVLRQFYNPNVKNPRRYFSIFSKIMTLKPGDKIYLTYDNIRYTYIVKTKHVVKPEDTFILEQQYDVKHLKLVTCFPEGTYEKRGVVTAELLTTE